MRIYVIVALFALVKLRTPVRGDHFATVVEPERYSFVVLLSYGDSFCSGSIIRDYWILTSAYCLYKRTCEFMRIHPNVNLLDSITPIECYYHYMFKQTRFYYDIGLLKVENSLVRGTPKSKILPLPPLGVPYEQERLAFAVGWGKVKDGPFPNHLLAGYVEIADWESCNQHWFAHRAHCEKESGCPVRNIPRRSLCTLGMPEDPHTCLGDPGGPVIIQGKLAGIVSFPLRSNETHCCMLEGPAVHVRVVDYLPWILQHTDPKIDTRQYDVEGEFGPN